MILATCIRLTARCARSQSAAMASVPPPLPTYHPLLPTALKRDGVLSAPQLAVTSVENGSCRRYPRAFGQTVFANVSQRIESGRGVFPRQFRQRSFLVCGRAVRCSRWPTCAVALSAVSVHLEGVELG